MDAAMMNAVEKWAADEFRSVNGQIEWIITNALKQTGRAPGRQPAEKPDEE